MPAVKNPGSADALGRTRGSSRLRLWQLTVLTVLLAVVVTAGVRSFVADVYTVDQVSMQPTVDASERILVDRLYPGEDGVGRGDVVVFDGTGSFAPYQREPGAVVQLAERVGHWFGVGSPPETYVKRVIGIGGDTVACCDDDGRLTINGEPSEEPYLHQPAGADTEASELAFEVEVPSDRLWVMGDNREESMDSRSLLGAPGGGMISEDRLIGRATDVFWPWNVRRSVQGTDDAFEDTSDSGNGASAPNTTLPGGQR